jgi:tetratricopeptide (TPR) repeat protein
MNLTGKKVTFHRKAPTNFHPARILFLLGLIFGLVFLARAFDMGVIHRPFDPTPTPTRTNQSFILEAETHFKSGNLPAAINAYQQAITLNPRDASLYAEMARIQVYSSASLSTDDQKRKRLQEALTAINTAAELAPEDSNVHEIKAFVLDWNSNPVVSGDDSENLLTQAEQEAVRALQLDNTNTMALAYYAEVLIDSQKYTQAEQYIEQALTRDSGLMDAHRVRGQLWEINGNYLKAIEEYKKATEIMPNLTFIYIYIGLNYRVLAAGDPISPYYIDSLDYFEKAANINATLGINDPIPYLAIAKDYVQMGEAFVAARNGQKALEMDPTNPDVYGQLGIIYFMGKNYEGSIPALKCAIRGCTPVESCEARQCDPEVDPQIAIEGMPLSNSTVVYYYTYGSVLAGLSRVQQNYCPEAITVFREIRAVYGGDKDIMSIVQEGERVCEFLDNPTVPTAVAITPTP